MATPDTDRRRVLKTGGALTVMGAAAPFAAQLAAAGEAAAQVTGNYQALVCVYLYGGNDAHNTVLATDSDNWSRYFAARNVGFGPIALMPPGTPPCPIGQVSPITGRISAPNTPESWGGVLPIVPATPQPIPMSTSASPARTFALHPFLSPMLPLFNQGRLAILANVGPLIQPTTKAQFLSHTAPVPQSLFSHFDQQGAWQATINASAGVGWGGAIADTIVSLNTTNSLFTAIAPSGSALPGGLSMFLAGRTARRYAITTGSVPADVIVGAQGASLFKSASGPAALKAVIENNAFTSNMANDYSDVVTRSISAANLINSTVAMGPNAAIPAAPNYVNPFTGVSAPSPLAQQLRAVAVQIAAAAQLGMSRQVFFVTLGPFDTHHSQNLVQPDLLGQLAQSLAYFDGALSNVNGVDMRNSVTTFTASDFGRSFTMNGSGTDHAWGGHQFILGGAVRGGDIYNAYPTLGIDSGSFNNPDMAGTALVPTVSVEQYGATLASWLGVKQGDLANIFPNLVNFRGTTFGANIGFV
jgi:uncharacterized protein (DUF1501 family)